APVVPPDVAVVALDAPVDEPVVTPDTPVSPPLVELVAVPLVSVPLVSVPEEPADEPPFEAALPVSPPLPDTPVPALPPSPPDPLPPAVPPNPTQSVDRQRSPGSQVLLLRHEQRSAPGSHAPASDGLLTLVPPHPKAPTQAIDVRQNQASLENKAMRTKV